MSIFKKISILFFLSIFVMGLIGFWTNNINNKRVNKLIQEKYLAIVEDIIENIENEILLNKLLNEHHFKTLKKSSGKDFETLYSSKYDFGKVEIIKESFEDEFIILIDYFDKKYIFKAPDEQNIIDKYILNSLVFLDIFLLFLIFIYILKLLSPLKVITKQIENFAQGNLETRIDINSKNEIGTLAKTFNTMAASLENSIKTREELLRDIGHELRTPIAKGKFAIEKIDDFSQKELLKKIFKDLELLTNELLELEKLDLTKLNKTTFNAETLVIEALGKLYLDDESKIDVLIDENFKIQADLYYLSIAVKNLIDNAIKYSTHLPIIIEIDKNQISILKLSKEFEYYLKPFTQELSQRDGFGLGLSIVKKVIDRHDFSLSYSYENDFNIFKINFGK